jgi:hypothetical protein
LKHSGLIECRSKLFRDKNLKLNLIKWWDWIKLVVLEGQQKVFKDFMPWEFLILLHKELTRVFSKDQLLNLISQGDLTSKLLRIGRGMSWRRKRGIGRGESIFLMHRLFNIKSHSEWSVEWGVNLIVRKIMWVTRVRNRKMNLSHLQFKIKIQIFKWMIKLVKVIRKLI